MIQKDRIITDYSTKKILPFIIACVGYVSLVNITKVPDSDLIWYLDSYERAFGSKFFEYLLVSGPFGNKDTDIGYALFSWIISNTTHANISIFVFLHSFISYSFLCMGLFRWGRFLSVRVSVFMTSIIIACFFPYIFTRSAHIMRQFSASCLLLYVTSIIPSSENNIITFFKKSWWLLLLMFSFHKSSLFFIILFFIPFLRKPFFDNKLKYIFFITALLAYQVVATFILPFFTGSDSALATAVSRASTGTTFELEALKTYEFLIIFLIAGIALFKLRNIEREGLRLCLNLIVILTAFILMNVNQLEMSRRFFYYLLVFLPFTWMLVASGLKIQPLISFICSFLVFVSFALYTEYGFWVYDVPWGVILTPIFGYHFNNSVF